MIPRLLTLCGATLCCTTISAQDTTRKGAFPYTGYVRPQLRSVDTIPASRDSLRVIQLRTFEKRGRNYLEDSLAMDRLLRARQQPTLGQLFNFNKDKWGNTITGAEGRVHHVPGIGINLGHSPPCCHSEKAAATMISAGAYKPCSRNIFISGIIP